MKEKKEKYNILLIFSKLNDSKFESNIQIIEFIKSVKHDYLNFTCIVDPSRENLELLLQKNKYLCIIPFTQYTINQQHDTVHEINNYIISQLLKSLKIHYFGSPYLTNLVLNDKTTYSQMPLGAPAPLLLTRYNHMKEKLNELNTHFPILLEPIYSKNYLAKRLYHANSVYEVSSLLDDLFMIDHDIDEIYIYKNINYKNEIHVNIIGNPPYSIHTLTKYIKGSNNGTIIKNIENYAEIISNSFRIFDEYNFSDFGQFKYVYNIDQQKYNLIGINNTNAFNSRTVFSLQYSYNINLIQILSIFSIVYLVKNINNGIINDYIPILSIDIPIEIINNILPLALRKDYYPENSYKFFCDELKLQFLQEDERNRSFIIKYLKNAMQSIPSVKNSNDIFIGGMERDFSFLKMFENIPDCPQNAQAVLNTSTKIFNGQMRWHSSNMLYNINPPVMLNAVVATTLTKLYNPNAISDRTSAGFIDMESQIIRQLSNLLNWDSKNASGIFTPGGKYCLIYAIKCGLNRCDLSSKKPVVITSEINHFSIESVCNHLGISGQCRRVPICFDGTIDFDAFKLSLQECFEKQIPVACIIFSGGNTTHCNVEDVRKGKEIVDELVKKFHLNYSPYIYFDLVVGWPWLFFKQYDFKENTIKIEEEVLRKIQYTCNKIKNSNFVDGVGIDFHKAGFAPYTNSVFLSKDAVELYSIANKNINSKPEAPHQYSMGNSRETSDILVTWNILQSIGIRGFQAYIANMITVANVFEDVLPNYGFTIVQKNNTYGFTTVIWASHPLNEMCFSTFCESDREEVVINSKYLFNLSKYWIENMECSYQTRFIPNYKTILNGKEIAIIALLPMTLNIDKVRAQLVADGLGKLKQNFDNDYLNDISLSYGEMPDFVEK